MTQIFETIREQNIVDYGKKFEDWAPRILVDQYSDKTHFIFELLQNAEDAEATRVHIQLYKTRLVLIHDGREFTEDDIRGICGVSASTKRNANNRIGKFGIGFKSVYAYTATPRIQSGKWDFTIRNLIMPYDNNSGEAVQKTIFTLPFDAHKQEESFSEIARSLRKNLTSDSMLTLRNIREIRYTIDGTTDVTIEKSVRLIGKGIQDVKLTVKNNLTPSVGVITEKLLAFVSEDVKPVLIAYKVQEAPGRKRNILPITNTYLYAFFPTAIETHQNFYIHAPFDTTPARDNIRNNEYNIVLIEKIADLICDSVKWLKQQSCINLKFFNQVYPLYSYATDHILKPLYDAGIGLIMSDVPVLPTNEEGAYVGISNCYIPESQNIISCITQPLLQSIMANASVKWLDKAIVSEASRPFREYLQRNFSVKVLGWKELVPNLSQSLLEKQPDAWLISLLKSIQPYCYLERGDDRIDASALPLVRLQNGRHCYAQISGKNQVYLNNPTACPRKIKETILADFFAKNFYSKVLGIQNYDLFQEIQDVVLPQYVENPAAITDELNLSHIKLIQKAFTENNARAKQLLHNAPFLKSTQGEWIAPANLFIEASYFRTKPKEYYLLDKLAVSWLSPIYKQKVPVDSLVQFGCRTSLCAVKIPDSDYEALLDRYNADMYEQYCTGIMSKNHVSSRDNFDWKRSIEYLPYSVTNLGLEASVALAEYLSHNMTTFMMNGTVFAANDAAMRGKTLYQMENLPSALKIILLTSKWLYTKDGVAVMPCERKRSDLSPAYSAELDAVFEFLPFQREDNMVDELVEKFDPRYHTFLSELLNNNEALSAAFNVYEQRKKVQSKKAKQSDVKTVFEQLSASGKTTVKPSDDEDLLDAAGAVGNASRRADKLADLFRQSLTTERPERVAKVHFSFSDCNQGERAFLLSQYNGHCQICGKQIIKRDGTPYFIARNMLDVPLLDEKYRQSYSEGWNSLCLCPNCAAEYLYGGRDLRAVPEQVMGCEIESGSYDRIAIMVELQGRQTAIQYTPKHLLALRSALKVFYCDADGEE